MSEVDVRALIRQGELSNELELQKASLGVKLLNLECEQNPELEPLRNKLVSMIIAYESLHWSGKETISNEQMQESDLAEERVAAERKFLDRRKELILERLKFYGLNQNDLAVILAHNKSYTSELLNGIRAISINDLVIIHRLFEVKLEELIFTELPVKVQKRVNETIEKSILHQSKRKNLSRITSLVNSISVTRAVAT